jgi:PAS domain S-box-containing protein
LPPSQPARILLVDDDSDVLRALSQEFEAEGFSVLCARSGREALDLLPTHAVDLALIDLSMPELDGIETTRLIKQLGLLSQVPLVVVSGVADVSVRVGALVAGAEEFLTKPFEPSEVGVRLRKLIAARTASLELAAQNEALRARCERAAFRERLSQHVLDASSALSVVLDREAVIVAANRAWLASCQQAAQKLDVGQPYSAEFLADEAHAGRLQAGVSAVLRGELEEFSVDYTRERDGKMRFSTARITRVPGGDEPFVLVSHEDVTERRESQTALSESTQKLQDAQKQLVLAQKLEPVGRLAGGVAHDFNNMLTSIICFTRFVVDDMAVEDPRRADLVEVLKAADSAARLTNQLLAFSRRKPVQPVHLDVNAALTGVGRVLRRLLGERIELVIIPAEEPLSTLFDPGQFDQLIFNLAVNAKDAMPNGGTISFRLMRQRLDADAEHPAGDYVELLVTDTGEGMTPEVVTRAFEPFFSTKGERGTGIGLTTCFGIVQQAQGTITVQSQPGTGTTFRVLLPRAEELRRADLNRAANVVPLALTGTALVVEDQPAILRNMARALSSAGLTVLEAASGEDALAVLEAREHLPELVVTDLILPRMGGQHLVQLLRQRKADLKVLYVSGYLGDELQQIRTDENTGFVSKPFTGRQLAVRAAALLAPRTAASEADGGKIPF